MFMKRASLFSIITMTMAAFAGTSLAQAPFAQVQGDQFVIDGNVWKIKGTNYYPRKHMWADMWTYWNWADIQSEVAMMRDFGINAVRILVPYSNGGWNGPDVPSYRLQQLEDLVNLMGQNGIRSVVTIFDWETSFPAAGTSTESDHLQYLSTIVNRLKNNPYVLMWDVKNEPDHPANYGWCTIGSDPVGNWDCNPSKRDQIVSWLERMCNYTRMLDPNHPAGAGMRWWENCSDVIDFVDVAIFHSYDWPIDQEITETMACMGGDIKPILVEEWGWPSNPTPCDRGGPLIYIYNENYQLQVYQNHLTAFQNHDIAGGLQWMTFDAKDYTTNKDESFEHYFGLWRYNLTLKPAAEYYRDQYAALPFPGEDPGELAGVTAQLSGPSVVLDWTTPSDADYQYTAILHSTEGFAATPYDGTVICELNGAPGSAESYTHHNPVQGQTNYYTLFAMSDSFGFSSPVERAVAMGFGGDYDQDDDADMADFAVLQRCITGQGVTLTDTNCRKADFDFDDDVDRYDVALWQRCAAGSGLPVDLACLQEEIDHIIPDHARSPMPADQTGDLSNDSLQLSWTTGTGADSHDVYFGTTNPPPLVGNQTGSAYETDPLAYETTYYWRIDERNEAGASTGQVWSFTTGITPPVVNLNRYELAENFTIGSQYYLDSTETIRVLSPQLIGFLYIMTADSDKAVTNSTWLTFDLGIDANVYIAYDRRGTPYGSGTLPSWISQNYTDSGYNISTQDYEASPMPCYMRHYTAGSHVVMGGNMAYPADGAERQYIVIIEPTGN